MHFGERLRQVRETAHLTQDELAQRVHLPSTAISKIESGVRQVRIDEALRLARVLHVDLVALLTDDDQPPTPEFTFRQLRDLIGRFDPDTLQAVIAFLRTMVEEMERAETCQPRHPRSSRAVATAR